MTSNLKIDIEWFKMLIKEKYTLDEIAAKDCVWMSGEEIASLLGIKYKRDPSPLAIEYARDLDSLSFMKMLD